jgi:hypothetical protein
LLNDICFRLHLDVPRLVLHDNTFAVTSSHDMVEEYATSPLYQTIIPAGGFYKKLFVAARPPLSKCCPVGASAVRACDDTPVTAVPLVRACEPASPNGRLFKDIAVGPPRCRPRLPSYARLAKKRDKRIMDARGCAPLREERPCHPWCEGWLSFS